MAVPDQGSPCRAAMSSTTSENPHHDVAASQESLSEFTLFPKLPPEIQSMVWECTLPDARVIEIVEFWPELSASREKIPGVTLQGLEAASMAESGEEPGVASEDDGDDTNASDESSISDDESEPDGSLASSPLSITEMDDYVGLRHAARVSTFLEYAENGRNTWSHRLEPCPMPIALHVCRESRAVALRHYVLLQDPVCESRSFYMDPKRDVLWLSVDVLDDGPEHIDWVRKLYGPVIDRIEHILIDDLCWEECGAANFYARYLRKFAGIKHVRVLLDREDAFVDGEDEDENEEDDDDDDDDNDEHQHQGEDDGAYQNELERKPQDPEAAAVAMYNRWVREMAARDKKVLRNRFCTLEYSDWDETIYHQVSLKA